MDWFFLIAVVAAFVGGWYCSRHAATIEASAARAITAATTIHTPIVAVNTAAATVGKEISAAIDPATATALASLAAVK